MTESQHSLTNPSDIPHDYGDTGPLREQSYPENNGNKDKQLDCNDSLPIHTQFEPQTNEKSSADEAWRNFVMNAGQNVCNNKPPKLCEQVNITNVFIPKGPSLTWC